MGERRLVALLKELLILKWGLPFSINISPLRGFFRQTSLPTWLGFCPRDSSGGSPL